MLELKRAMRGYVDTSPPHKVIIVSVIHTGTHFIAECLHAFGMNRFQRFHIGDQRVNNDRSAPRISPLRDPLACAISFVQRYGGDDWESMLREKKRFHHHKAHGDESNAGAWKSLFELDTTFVKIDHGDRMEELRKLRPFVEWDDAIAEEIVKQWPRVQSWGDDHELKRAYFKRDRNKLVTLIEPLLPIVPLFEGEGYEFWWK